MSPDTTKSLREWGGRVGRGQDGPWLRSTEIGIGHQETEGSTLPGQVDERTGGSVLPTARTAPSGLAFGGFHALRQLRTWTAEALTGGSTDSCTLKGCQGRTCPPVVGRTRLFVIGENSAYLLHGSNVTLGGKKSYPQAQSY